MFGLSMFILFTILLAEHDQRFCKTIPADVFLLIGPPQFSRSNPHLVSPKRPSISASFALLALLACYLLISVYSHLR